MSGTTVLAATNQESSLMSYFLFQSLQFGGKHIVLVYQDKCFLYLFSPQRRKALQLCHEVTCITLSLLVNYEYVYITFDCSDSHILLLWLLKHIVLKSGSSVNNNGLKKLRLLSISLS